MFSIANRVDNIHKRPWIGFQSWRAAGRKVSLMLVDFFFNIQNLVAFCMLNLGSFNFLCCYELSKRLKFPLGCT